MSGIEQELGPKGFAVVAGTLNDDPNIPDFIQRFHPTFPVGEANKLDAIHYMQFQPGQRLPFVPYMVFIDRKGVIRAQYIGSDKILDETQSDKLLRDEALKLLGEKSKPTSAAH